MVERPYDEGAVRGAQGQVHDVSHILPVDVAVGDHGALRVARRARGVHDPLHVAQFGRGRRDFSPASPLDSLLIALPAPGGILAHAQDMREAGKFALDGSDGGMKRGLGDENGDPGVVEDVSELRAREAEVQGDDDRPEPGDCEIRFEKLRAIVKQHRHPVATAHADFFQAGREIIHPLPQGGPGEAPPRSDHRLTIRCSLGPAGQDMARIHELLLKTGAPDASREEDLRRWSP